MIRKVRVVCEMSFLFCFRICNGRYAFGTVAKVKFRGQTTTWVHTVKSRRPANDAASEINHKFDERVERKICTGNWSKNYV